MHADLLSFDTNIDFQAESTSRQLARFFSFTQNPCCIAGFDGYFKKVNAAFCALIECKEEELLSKPFRSFPYFDGLVTEIKNAGKKRNGNSSYSIFATYTKSNQECIVIEWTYIIDEEEKLAYAIGKDVTSLKKKESELEAINERYDLVSKATSEAIWDWEVGENRFFCHGSNFKKLFGYDIVNDYAPSELWEQNLDPDTKENIVLTQWNALHNTSEYWNDQYWFKKANGEYAYVKDRALIVRDEAGNAIRMIGAMDDITAQKLAEDALIESEKSYMLLFNNAPLPQFIYDIQTLKILKVNDAAVRHYGYTSDEFLKMQATDIRPKEEVDEFGQYLNRIKKTNEPVTGIWTHARKNGEKFIAEVSPTRIVYHSKNCILSTVNDITDKVKLEEKLIGLRIVKQKRITEATINAQENERTQLGKELHDNISQVLTTTKLYLELAEANENIRLDLIEKSKNNLLNLINEVRALSKSLMPPILEDIGLEDAIYELVETYIVTQRLNIKFHYSSGLDALAKDLKICLYRIVQEQLSNIARHAEAKNVIISLEANAPNINLVITDDGKGFNTTLIRKGIGINNIKNRIELYSGNLDIISSPGNGCTLRIKFPLTATESKKTLNILIAEDDPDDQTILKIAFSEVAPHSQVTYIPNGEKMIEQLKTTPDDQLPSLIVLDYNMPVLNGLETLKLLEIDQRYKSIPKIVYSSAYNDRYKEQCFSANATAYLEKSVTIDEIKDNVKQMLAFCS